MVKLEEEMLKTLIALLASMAVFVTMTTAIADDETPRAVTTLSTPPIGAADWITGMELMCTIVNVGNKDRTVLVDMIQATGANAGRSIFGRPLEVELAPGAGHRILEGSPPTTYPNQNLIYCQFSVEGPAGDYRAAGCVQRYEGDVLAPVHSRGGCVVAY